MCQFFDSNSYRKRLDFLGEGGILNGVNCVTLNLSEWLILDFIHTFILDDFCVAPFVSLYNTWSFNWAELQVVPDEHSYPPVADKVTSRQTWLKLLLGCVLHSNSEIEEPRFLVY